MTIAITVLAAFAVILGFGLLMYAFRTSNGAAPQPEVIVPEKPAAPPIERASVERGTVNVLRPHPNSVEGLEIQYQRSGIVRSVRVGAMNCEHKELLLTMDEVAWKAMPNAQKQEVLAAARSTWASRMCPAGPDIAYVVIKTDCGEIVGRASPRTVTIL